MKESENPGTLKKSGPLKEAEKVLSRYLEESEKRQTPERFAILAKAFELKAHFGVNDLLEAVENSGYHVSRATVYNTVEILCACGILRRHLLDSRHASYELAHGNHIHLVCSRCGAIEEIHGQVFEDSLLAGKIRDFSPRYFSATVFGICGNCSRAEIDRLHSRSEEEHLKTGRGMNHSNDGRTDNS